MHYVIEFVDSFFKYRIVKNKNSADFIIFDRYPYDRLIPLLNGNYLKTHSNILNRVFRYLLNKYLGVYGLLYLYFLPSPTVIYFLDTNADLLFERKQEHYKNFIKAEQSQIDYRRLFDLLKKQPAAKVYYMQNNLDMLLETLNV